MLTFAGHAEDSRLVGEVVLRRRAATDPWVRSSACPNRVRSSLVRMTAGQEREASALMTLAQQGDAVAYAALLTILASTARQYVRNRFGDVAWLDDVAQETLLTIHAARRTYDARRPFAPWFYAILSSRMIDVLRKEKRVSTREF